MIPLKSTSEMMRMRETDRTLALLSAYLQPLLQPGMFTAELGQEENSFLLKQGAGPAFERYRGYPATLCTSINEVVSHGIPGPQRLREGDIVGIDVGAHRDGF